MEQHMGKQWKTKMSGYIQKSMWSLELLKQKLEEQGKYQEIILERLMVKYFLLAGKSTKSSR